MDSTLTTSETESQENSKDTAHIFPDVNIAEICKFLIQQSILRNLSKR